MGHPVEPAQGVAQLCFGPALPHHLVGVDHIAADLFGALHQTAARVELLFLARLRVQLVQLCHGVAQVFFFGGNGLAFGGGLFGSLARSSQCRPRLTHLGPQRSRAGEFIQNGAVALGVKQPAVVMLSVQLDQRLGQGAQHLARAAAIVDPSRFTPVGPVDTAQDQLCPAGQARLFQHRVGCVAFGQVEPCRDLALRRALTHQIGAPAPAQHEPEAIEQDRFTCPGFAGQNVQTRLKRKFQPVDDQHIRNI